MLWQQSFVFLCIWKNLQKNEKLQSAERGEILVVPPSTQTRVKVPVTLGEKIKECNEPLVGLADVREVLPISNREMEPHYYCDLCNQQGQANCMLLHLKYVPTFTIVSRIVILSLCTGGGSTGRLGWTRNIVAIQT